MKRLVLALSLLIFGSHLVFAAETQTLIARMWHGKTQTQKANEYEKYLMENGISKIKGIAGNKGVQLLRKTNGDLTEFMVVSYWESFDAIKKFAGQDYEKAYQLPRDPEFLVEPETKVQHYEVHLNDWKK